MSDNKMGGVPPQTRAALYRFFERQNSSDDAAWARVIDTMTQLGVVKTLEKLKE